MVPTNNEKILFVSNLNTLNNIILKIIENADTLKNNIMKQDWNLVNELSSEQEKLNIFFDESIKKIKSNSFDKKHSDNELINLKNTIKTNINIYKEKEILNAKLLNDAMFASKKKVEHFFKQTKKTDTYSKEVKKENKLWDDKPIMYSRII